MKPLHNISLLMILFKLFSLCTARDTLTQSQPLADNETLVSSGGRFTLGFFTPAGSGNRYFGLWYSKITDQTILWVANREDPVVNSTGTLSISAGGRLTITSKNSTLIWSTENTALKNPVAQLLDTGNFVVKAEGNHSDSYAWQGFDYPTDTMIPGMKLGFDGKTGLNLTLTAWKSNNDPSPGEHYLFLDISGDPQIFLCTRSNKISRSWAESQESVDPSIYNGFTSQFVNTTEEVTYSYLTTNQSVLSRIVVNQSGILQLSLWLGGSSQWIIAWYSPKDPCDNYAECGPYGVCDPNTTPLCSCLPGFSPKNPTKWKVGDGSDGCVRDTTLDCKNIGTNGFVVKSYVRLPESSNSTVNMSLSHDDECRVACLKNCSCTAYAIANVSGSGGGCLIWVSELLDIRLDDNDGLDLYVRHAGNASTPGKSPVSAPSKSHKSRIPLVAIIIGSMVTGILLIACVGCLLFKRKNRRSIIGSMVTGILLMIACVGCLLFKRKKRRSRVLLDARKNVKDRPIEGAEENDLDLPFFDFGTIEVATNFFSVESKLGEGGYGPVYKGILGNNQEIAVKRLSKSSQQGAEEFKNEVMLIAKLQHRNLVRLLGCCIQGEERILIYEYMPNKSLDAFLFDKTKGAVLDWQTRHQIIIGITRGLLYLHHDSRLRIIHRDLKASNVLLDTDMNPKISDFGMARIFGGDDKDFNTRRVVGTYGYMSPEYAMEGIFSVKSDIFSFGVLLLEIISGRKNRGEYAFASHLNLVAHAWSLWNEDRSLQLVDEALNKSFPVDEVLKYIKIGLLCVQEHPEDRPLISSVIQILGSDIAKLPQPKQPGFVARMCPVEADASPRRRETASNEMTNSLLEGR